MSLKSTDPLLAELISEEAHRQQYGLEMIASENYTSAAVMEAQGSVLTNKYAEGYPGKRYYGGCEVVDKVEQLAIDRAKQIFKCEHANVQPHSGSQANMAVYLAALKPGDTVLGMDLSHGGHLTHGSPVNFSGLLFKAHGYGLDPDSHRIEYDSVLKRAREVQPQLIIAGYSAYPRQLDFAAFRKIADEVGAKLLVDMAHFAGLVATGAHPSPVPYADFITSTTHKTLRGPRGGIILCNEENSKVINSRIFPGIQGGPLEHVIAAKATAFQEILQPSFRTYIDQVVKNAKVLAEALVAEGFKLVTGGTDNHLLLIDLSESELTGKEAERRLGQCSITVNKNTVPNEKRSPFITSGIRVGTPALTTRGMVEKDMQKVAQWISRALKSDSEKEWAEIKKQVEDFAGAFPLFHRV